MIFQDHNSIKDKRCPFLLELIFDMCNFLVSTVKSRNLELSPTVIFCSQHLRFTAGTETKLLISRGWKLNNLTSVIHYSLGVSSNYSLFFLSSCWLFIIHNRFRVQGIALVKFRFNYNTFGNNITQLTLLAQFNFHFSTWPVPQATPVGLKMELPVEEVI